MQEDSFAGTRKRPTTPEPRARFLLRLSPSLKVELENLAHQEHRSLNRQIEFLLDRATRGPSEKRGPADYSAAGLASGHSGDKL